jgi:hypothetical protein
MVKALWKALALGVAAGMVCLGCGANVEILNLVSPNISQVSPQVVTVGTPSVTLMVKGTHFNAQSAVIFNGTRVPTSVVSSDTLAAQVGGSALAQATVAPLQVQNSNGQQSNTVPVTVQDAQQPNQPPALTIAAGTLPGGQVNAVYMATLSANGGTPGYTWTVPPGTLPAGLTMSTAGVISGTPAATGTFNFTVTVTDSGSPTQTQTASFSITVAPAPTTTTQLTISTTALSGGQVGTGYNATLSANGGTPGYTWTVPPGTLPAGLTMSSSGVITGTPTASGPFSFTVTVTDSGSPTQTKTGTVTITISPSKLTITSTTLASGQVGTAYTASLGASGGMPGYTWMVPPGTLPAGLTMSGSGVITGTPTAPGAFSFSVTVTDSGSQTQTATVSITIAPTKLTITSSTLANGVVGVGYNATLGASGGTTGYKWTASGALPGGLSLSSGGAITGTPTAYGTFNFFVTVTDSGSPAQMVTVGTSITIAPSTLTVTSAALPAGESGVAYSVTLGAGGGTPGYTWTVPPGTLPAGLTMSTSGVISGTPTATGTFNFTVTVTDSGSPAQMVTWAASIVVNAAPTSPTSPGITWYVRPDGGTRYSSNATNGQCDGQGDVSYADALAANGGVVAPNLHCAFNDVRLLWQDGSFATDGSTFPAWGWVINGGDTVIIRGSIVTGVSYRVGWTTIDGCTDTSIPGGQAQIRGLCGDPYGSGPMAPPSGTATQHTRILGENYQACATPTAKTQLHGGWAVGHVWDMSGSSYVDVACLDITDFSNCGRASQASQCEVNGQTVADFAQDGIEWTNTSTNDTLTDIYIHGLASNGMFGPTGDGVVMTRIGILGNAVAGWDADNSTGTTGVGSLLVQDFNISWNGCAEEYPIVDAVPYGDCTDDSSGGYGDGFGTATVASPAPGWQIHFDNGIATYNTQDGLDALHVSGPGSSMTDTRVLAYGNQGQQLKVGGAAATIENSVIVGNCMAMISQNIPGTPAGFGSKLADPCRAGNTAVVVNVSPGDPAVYQYNTLYSNGAVGLEIEYATSDKGPSNIMSYNNNIFVGFMNTGGSYATSIYSTSDLNMLMNPGSSWTNNVEYNNHYGCPMWTETNAVCGDPGLTDETWHAYGYGNMSPSQSGNAVQGAGVAIPGITTDYTGAPRGNPPTIGAYENYVSTP